MISNFKPRNLNLSKKSLVINRNSMVVSSHQLASSVGIEILRSGGNAVDAALAMSSVLCVAEPHMTGVGGDCFVMLSPDGSTDIKALNGSGNSSLNVNAEGLRKKNIYKISPEMPEAITIPGAVAGWSLLHREYGYMPWNEIFKPAIKLSQQGVCIHERVAFDWVKHTKKLSSDTDTSKLFLKNGKPYEFMDIFKNKNLSETFNTIAEEGADGFYRGWIADDMVQKLNSIGGNHTKKDFDIASAEWVKPISGYYRNFKIYECPPNGQGIVVLIILAILEKFNFEKISETDYLHIFCEASKIGYYLRDKYLADPSCNKLSLEKFLDSKTLDKYVSKIDMKKAKNFKKSDFPDHPDTVYLTARDKNGMTVSFINSLFDAFGSGITTSKSGILFHSRGRAFNLINGHPNELNSNKKPLHTIIPAMISKDDNLLGSFGVMGGQYQAAGQAYVLSKIIDFGFNPQDAIDFPRVFPNENILDFEYNFDKEIIDKLMTRGHKVNYPAQLIGGGQMLIIDNSKNLLLGASDWRKDGCAIGY